MQRRALLLTALAAPLVLRAQTPKRVLIIGAGAAGLTAGHRLQRVGITVQIFDARPMIGGRIAELTGFADVPLDIGAEWIHGPKNLLNRIADQRDLNIQTIDYRPQTYQSWNGSKLRKHRAADFDEAEHKFHHITWHRFFADYIARDLNIQLNAQIRAIDRDRQGVSVTLADGRRFDGDRVLVTVPLSVLQRGIITFPTALPKDLHQITFGQGFKIFLKFKKRFYPDILIASPLRDFLADSWTEKTYYDAAFGKNSADHILGLFYASQTPIPADQPRLETVLAQLDQIYDGAATREFLGGFVQNWTNQPHIWGSYSMESDASSPISTLLAPQNGQIFFAGEALGGADQSTVHGAAFSGIQSSQMILDS